MSRHRHNHHRQHGYRHQRAPRPAFWSVPRAPRAFSFPNRRKEYRKQPFVTLKRSVLRPNAFLQRNPERSPLLAFQNLSRREHPRRFKDTVHNSSYHHSKKRGDHNRSSSSYGQRGDTNPLQSRRHHQQREQKPASVLTPTRPQVSFGSGSSLTGNANTTARRVETSCSDGQFIYIMVSKEAEQIYKVGKTKNVEQRVKDLSTNNHETRCLRTFQVDPDMVSSLEAMAHQMLRDDPDISTVVSEGSGRELFRGDYHLIEAIVESVVKDYIVW